MDTAAKSTTAAKNEVFRPRYQQIAVRQQGRGIRVLKLSGLFSLACLVLWRVWISWESWRQDLSGSIRSSARQAWSWEALEPAEQLIWSKCYDDLECSRLSVPLDWLNPSDGRKVVLAVVRKNATDHTNYLGPVFVNPGGPGGSGVEWVIEGGKTLQAAAGENHDIISWDPRGVGATTPSAHCWSTPQEAQIWEMGKLGLVDSHPDMLYDIYARVSLLNTQCERNMGELTKYAGTTSVARDMLAISEALGLDKVRFWGQSYGTVLGGTFAAMFPEKVERMVLDGTSLKHVPPFPPLTEKQEMSISMNGTMVLAYISPTPQIRLCSLSSIYAMQQDRQDVHSMLHPQKRSRTVWSLCTPNSGSTQYKSSQTLSTARPDSLSHDQRSSRTPTSITWLSTPSTNLACSGQKKHKF